MMKYVAMDLEGDGLSKEINKMIFPQSPHWDPNTRIWCASFTKYGIAKPITETYVCKLDNKPRYVGKLNGEDYYTRSYHYKSTIIPDKINDVEIVKFETTDYIMFLQSLYMKIVTYNVDEYELVVKPYGDYNYDLWLLNKELTNFNLRTLKSNFLMFQPSIWEETSKQVHTNQYKDNQHFLYAGIIHNIEDSKQLYNRIFNMEGDFK